MANHLKYLFIINPSSHSGRGRKKFPLLIRLLDEAGIDYEYKITKNIDDAYKFSLEANKNKLDVITAVGGDGTINAVLNGFYDTFGKRISTSKFGVIYTGTSPDFCKSYGIPTNIKQAVTVLLNNKSRFVKVGKIILSRHNKIENHGLGIDKIPDAQVKYFACCANIGLGASLARLANKGVRKYLGDFVGTFSSLLRVILSYKPGDITEIIDGHTVNISKFYNLSVGITPYIASGIKVQHKLNEDDDRFYCLLVKNLSLLKLPGLLRKIYSGKPIKTTSYLFLHYASNIEIEGNYKNPDVEFDGDPAGFLPCRIDPVEDRLELIS
jgi:diacylglycerol kinase family enzyme